MAGVEGGGAAWEQEFLQRKSISRLASARTKDPGVWAEPAGAGSSPARQREKPRGRRVPASGAERKV